VRAREPVLVPWGQERVPVLVPWGPQEREQELQQAQEQVPEQVQERARVAPLQAVALHRQPDWA
jgi:hypothetical protein